MNHSRCSKSIQELDNSHRDRNWMDECSCCTGSGKLSWIMSHYMYLYCDKLFCNVQHCFFSLDRHWLYFRTVQWWTDYNCGSGTWTSISRASRSATSATRCYTGRPTSCLVNSVGHVASDFTPSVSIAGLTRATTRHARCVATSSNCHVAHLLAKFPSNFL